MPKISIITTVYNAKEQLPYCVNSILAQTFEDFELILVEDGSPNGCGELCDELAKKDPRIKVIHKTNGGPASAANAGLRAAKGEYIGVVDSDDLIDPDYYETLYNALQAHDCEIAACGADAIDEQGRVIDGRNVQCSFTGRVRALDLFYDVFQTGSMYGMLSWNKLFKADIFTGRGIYYDERMFFGDDASILHRVYDGCHVICSNEKKYHYRQRSDSITGSAFPARKLDDLIMYRDWLNWFKERRPQEEELFQWAIACYWRVFYVFYCLAQSSGSIKQKGVASGFIQHGQFLKKLLPDIQKCPYISSFEKKRASLFCFSPSITYRLASLWGKLHK